MDRKHRRMTEGLLYLFSLPSGLDKSAISAAIEDALETGRCGRVMGSGISLADPGTITIEIGAYDRDKADDLISHACRKLRCREFEISWD